MTWNLGLEYCLQFIYTVCALFLALYGVQSCWLVWLQWRYCRASLSHASLNKQREPIADAIQQSDWPTVTVQLPVYNEHHVIERLIDACAQFDYPTHRLQIQVLDDSDDLTTELANRRAEYWRFKGKNIVVFCRPQRTGYKAGALAYGLQHTSSDLIAIFDADFSPPADFLKRIVPYFLASENQDVGYVQARWEHLNRDYSPLTQCQSLALDAHFAAEQPARALAGYPFGFNGSAGMWRRSCIEDADVGGWRADSLCEDLDLSYRAQLAGWRGLFVPDLAAPAEIPPQLVAFKRQQFRWAKGSIQSLRMLAGKIWQSDWPLTIRIAGLLHLSNYLLHPALLIILLLTLPFLLIDIQTSVLLAPLSIASLGTPFLYAVAQRRLHPQRALHHLLYLPMLAMLGMGMCVSNSVAAWQGLQGEAGEFLRTPKFRVENSADHWQKSGYRLPIDRCLLAEVAMGFYAAVTAWVAFGLGKTSTTLFMLMYLAGFALIVGTALAQAMAAAANAEQQIEKKQTLPQSRLTP